VSTARRVREPAVAGLFYPARPSELGALVDALVTGVSQARPTAPVRALLCPHAGYAYSGAIAAHAFAAWRAPGVADPPTVVVIGPSHVEAFAFTSIYEGDAYRTPLGDVPVDTTIARALANRDDGLRLSPAGHALPAHGRGEHGIEVILPFLQRMLPGSAVVPVVMGDQDTAAAAALGGRIASVCDPSRTLIIASSDLSHFYADADARVLDAAFCVAFERLDPEQLLAEASSGVTEACGVGPVAATMVAVRHWCNVPEARILASANSGDTSGDRESVVGYAAGVITGVVA